MKDRTNISHAFYKNSDSQFFITNGISTLKKVSGFKIFGVAISFLLGICSLIYLFLVGFANLLKHKSSFITLPIFFVFSAILMLLISFFFIANQSFMNIGDATTGNIVLAIGSTVLPIFAVITVILTLKINKQYLKNVNFWMTIFVIQFCLLLILNNLLPIITWK